MPRSTKKKQKRASRTSRLVHRRRSGARASSRQQLRSPRTRVRSARVIERDDDGGGGAAAGGRTLYDRLGGIFPIAAVVDHFSDALLSNAVVGRDSANRQLRDWTRNKAATRLPGLKFMRTLWLAAVSGGPFQYTPVRAGRCPLSLENAHRTLQISAAEFDAVAAELERTLQHFGVPAREQREVLAAFAAHKGEVTTGYSEAHGLPVVPPTCPV